MNQVQSPLFRLPREIRDLIYSLLIPNQTVYVGRRKLPPKHCYGLVSSCVSLHSETIELYYQKTSFAISSENLQDGLEWLLGLPEKYRLLITKIVFLRSARYIDTYSMICLRTLSNEEQQAFLLAPLRSALDERGISFGEGVFKAEFAFW